MQIFYDILQMLRHELGSISTSIPLILQTTLRLAGAALMAGIIGYERQHKHRPAGMRTHVLVAVGSALVMCTSDFIVGGDKADITRMGAQVVSGIGFLGAGTIFREGFNVKGLTTAASLWAVACLGLAVGCGYWVGAVLGTAVIFFTLNGLKKVAMRHSQIRILYIGVNEAYHVSEKVGEIIRNCGAKLRSLQIIFPDDADLLHVTKNTTRVLKAMAYINDDSTINFIRENILALDGVNEFYTEEDL